MTFIYRGRYLGIIMVLLLFATVTAYGQEATPEPNGSPIEVVQRYFETRDPNLIAEDAQFDDPFTVQPIEGRDAVGALDDNFFGRAYNLDLVPWRYLHTDDTVVVEFQYRDPEAAPVAIPSPGLDRSVPMIGIYQVQDGQITSARVYYSAPALQMQTGAAGIGTAPGAVVAGSNEAREFTIIMNDPTSFYGEEVSVEGFVGRAINDRAFLLHQFDLVEGAGEGEMLVIDGTEDGLEFVQLADARVRIEGTVQEFNISEIENETGIDLNDDDFAEFESQSILVATSATNLDDVDTLSNLVDDAEAFYGQTVTVDGNIGRAVNDRAFVLYEGGLIGGEEVLVVNGSQDPMEFIQLADASVRVQGTASAFNIADIEAQIGADLDDTAFAEFENTPVIVASSISNLDNVTTIQNIINHPDAFYGHTVAVEGVITDTISGQAALLSEDAVLNVDRLLVVGTSAAVYDFTQVSDQRVSITGTVHPFTEADIESEFGLTLEDGAFNDYEGQPVLIAEEVSPLE